MPGRLVLYSSPKKISVELNAAEPCFDFSPSYNIPPSTAVLIVLPGMMIVKARWGLLPSWKKSNGKNLSMYNTRIESIRDKPYFSRLAASNRCAFPINGYFEWVGNGKIKQPYYIKPLHNDLIYCAGLYETPEGGEGELRSASIVTIPSSEQVASIHHRMPVFLSRELLFRWIDGTLGVGDLVRLSHSAEIEIYPVDPQVGSPSCNHPSNLERSAVGTLF